MKHARNIFSFFLAILIFFVSSGFTVKFHYCEGELEGWTVLGDAELCSHEEEVSCCSETVSCETKDVHLDEENCCSTTFATAELKNQFISEYSNLGLDFLPTYLVRSSFLLITIDNLDWLLKDSYRGSNDAPRSEMPIYKKISCFLI